MPKKPKRLNVGFGKQDVICPHSGLKVDREDIEEHVRKKHLDKIQSGLEVAEEELVRRVNGGK